MASMITEIKVIQEKRPCIVNGEKALFHTWEHYSEIIAPSLLKGGHSGGVVGCTFGIVEYESGEIKRVEPYNIKFCQSNFKDYYFEER